MIGTSLNQYRITASIGTGGMGEVFRARDTRLNRDVAIKVLPKDFASDADRLRRFEQEAKTLAALNHPNVLTVFDAGVHEGAPYLVSELLEGQTLREVLRSTANAALPVRKATEFALQIANGLAAAHGKGVIHRDLKPENIFVTKDGRVKILDFGLAKLKQVGRVAPRAPLDERNLPGGSQGTASPTTADTSTVVQPAAETTEPGMVLGTPAYMSPEQVRGEPADHRADIVSFGCVLYQMLSGTRAFRRDTPVASMNAVLSEEPPELSATNPSIPFALERVVRRCLEKQPDQRFQSAKDLAFALEGTSITGAPVRQRESPGWKWAALAFAAFALVAFVIVLRQARQPSTESNPLPATRLEITHPQGRFDDNPSPAISPDGRQIAYWASAPGDTNRIVLWVRSLDSPVARALPGVPSSGDIAPAWSPDGRSLAFFADGKLQRIDLDGGAPLALADAANPRGCTWGSSGIIVFVPATTGIAYKVPASGGEMLPLTNTRELGRNLCWPSFLPDGQHVVINTFTNGAFIVSVDGKDVRRLMDPRFSSRVEYADGHLFFGREKSLFAHPFDAKEMSLSGEPVRVAENLGFCAGNRLNYAFSVSPAGTLVYSDSRFISVSQLTWFTRDGQRLGTIGEPGEFYGFAVSPDARQLAIERQSPRGDDLGLWLLDANSGAFSRFTKSRPDIRVNAGYPVWSPFDDRIYFNYFPGIAAQSLQAPTHELLSSEEGSLCDVSPDGNNALVARQSPDSSYDLWIVPLRGGKEPFPLIASKHRESEGRFSPDGRWIAYVSNESGESEVYVRSFPESGRPVTISRGGGWLPGWRKDGKELYFLTPDDKLMAVAVDATQSPFRVSESKPLFQLNLGGSGGRRLYAPSENGERFLVSAAVENRPPSALNVVLNWKALLKTK